MALVSKIFKLSNLGTVIFFVLNLALILCFFTAGYTDFTNIQSILIIYLVGVAITLSPIGESILVFFAGGRKMKRTDMKIRMVPLLEVVYNKAIKECPNMVKSVHLKIVYDPVPNAFAIGRRTLCVTSGLFKLTDEEIMGVLAHELGHIANRHSELQLVIGSSNLFISVALICIKLVSWIFLGICSIFALKAKSKMSSFLIILFGGISAFFIWIWSKICIFFLKMSIRANEYEADKFAYDIGFGKGLAMALDKIHADVPSQNGFLKALRETHPNYNERIARLQNLGLEYYAY